MVRAACNFDTTQLIKCRDYISNLTIDSDDLICIREIINDISEFIDDEEEQIKLIEHKI
jgi:hypothetical protein